MVNQIITKKTNLRKNSENQQKMTQNSKVSLANVYKHRRQTLIKKMPQNSAIILATNSEKIRSNDVYYPFRAHSDFLYLTGFDEPGAVLFLCAHHFILFVHERDKESLIWDGGYLGTKGAVKELGADMSYSLDEFGVKLVELLIGIENIGYDFGAEQEIDKIIIQSVKKISHNRHGLIAPTCYSSLHPHLHEMRLIKDSFETNFMRKAIEISVRAHIEAIQKTREGLFEYEIASIFDNTFRYHNALHAYPAIVASGKNALTLHYIKNNAKLKRGDLLLIDAGAEVSGYVADITRTFPINMRFSSEQKAIYSIVLAAQKAAIKAIEVGKPIGNMHKAATQVISEGLQDLLLLKKNTADNNLEQFFMHATGHFLGLDVHDVGAYKIAGKMRAFKENMVTTVEPGIYIRPHKNIAKKWWNIAIRIEDDVLVRKDKAEILSEKLPREIKDIEELRSYTSIK